MFVHVDNARRAGSRYIRVSSKANTKSLRGKKNHRQWNWVLPWMVLVCYRKKWERSLIDEGKNLGKRNVGSIRWAGIPIMPWSQK